MRLATVGLKNFRCFQNEVVDLSPYTAIVGPNNSGKSTILKAIDLFFRTSQKSHPFSLSDFNDPKKELRVSLAFTEVPEKAQSPEIFGHYFRHGKLEFFIRAIADEGGHIEASVHGTRSGIEEFAGFFAASSAADKKAYYAKLQETFSDLPNLPARSAVDVLANALYEYEANNKDKHKLIDSDDLAFGAAGVAGRLKRYIDWVYIPAVKDAAEEDEEAKNTAFGVLVNRIIRAKVKVDEKLQEIRQLAHGKIETLVEDYKEEIKNLQSVLDGEFRKLTSTDAHIHLDWTEIDEDNVSLQMPLVRSLLSDDAHQGDITEFGHGLQRNYLIALVHLNAKLAIDEQPSIILACEEPELYQHPPQARYLQTALQKIALTDQVLISTHSPLFISARTFENVRVVRKTATKSSKISKWTADEHRSLIAATYGEEAIGREATLATLESFLRPELNESFFCSKLVLVEGAEDRAILGVILDNIGLMDDFQRLGGHIVAVNGKSNLINMIALARGFETSYFLVFDADTGCKPDAVEASKALNKKIANLAGLDETSIVWPESDFFSDRAVVWSDNVQQSIFKEYDKWLDDVKAVCLEFGWNYDKLKKNPAVLSHALHNALVKGTKINCLNQAVEKLMAFAKG